MQRVNLFDYEQEARQRLDPATWDYLAGGSEDEITLRENCRAFRRLRFRPRVLLDTTVVDMQTTVQGFPVRLPVLVAPMALHQLAHPAGECASVAGVEAAGSLLIVSTFASRSLEEVAAVARRPHWFHLYMQRDRGLTEMLVRRAEQMGYGAFVLTVDTPRLGRRERDLRNNFVPPPEVRFANFKEEEIAGPYLPIPAVVTWKEVDWLRSLTTRPLILKGIMAAEDAELALAHGVDGIVVSNHGGRQLDGTIASIEVLPMVVDAVAGRCEVYCDGGVRRGTDVLKALALGARAVLVGRPILWGLAVQGEEGVHRVLALLEEELVTAMALSGCPTLAHIHHSLLQRSHARAIYPPWEKETGYDHRNESI